MTLRTQKVAALVDTLSEILLESKSNSFKGLVPDLTSETVTRKLHLKVNSIGDKQIIIPNVRICNKNAHQIRLM